MMLDKLMAFVTIARLFCVDSPTDRFGSKLDSKPWLIFFFNALIILEPLTSYLVVLLIYSPLDFHRLFVIFKSSKCIK